MFQVPSNASPQAARETRTDVRLVATKALLQLFEPLIGFVLDSGLSTLELHSIIREAAVRTVAARQLELARRVNISGIAASTGIPRGEISRILNSNAGSSRRVVDRLQQSTNRILAVWHQDPKFANPAGKPMDLRIYGRGTTFDSLVRTYGRGIPTRAMLDELTRVGAAEVLSSHLVRAKAMVAVDCGMTPRVIRSFGERAAELLSTMLQNMKNPDNPKFVACISGTNIPPAVVPLFRKELAGKGADFLADMRDSLVRETTGGGIRRTPQSKRVSVTIFYHESQSKQKRVATRKRRNFRRDGV
jgi:Family of unknown function (DUF6502)